MAIDFLGKVSASNFFSYVNQDSLTSIHIKEDIKQKRFIPQESSQDFRLKADYRSVRRSLNSAKQGLEFLSKAEESLEQIHDKLFELKIYADESASIITSHSTREEYEADFLTGIQEIDRIARSSSTSGVKLLDGSFSYDFKVGSGTSSGDQVRVKINSARINNLNSYEDSDPNKFYITSSTLLDTEKYNTGSVSVPDNKTAAQIAVDNSIDKIRNAISQVRSTRERFEGITEQTAQKLLHYENVEAKNREASKVSAIELLSAAENLKKLAKMKLDSQEGPTFNLLNRELPFLNKFKVEEKDSKIQNMNSFLIENYDLIQIFDDNDDLLNALKENNGKKAGGTIIEAREDLQNILNTHVLGKLGEDTKITSEDLSNNPELSQLLAINPDHLFEKIKSDPQLQELLVSDESYKSFVDGKISKMAADLFKSGKYLNKEFFKENVSAALFILKNPELVDRINENTKDIDGGESSKRSKLIANATYDSTKNPAGGELFTVLINKSDGSTVSSNVTINNGDSLSTAINTINANGTLNKYITATDNYGGDGNGSGTYLMLQTKDNDVTFSVTSDENISTSIAGFGGAGIAYSSKQVEDSASQLNDIVFGSSITEKEFRDLFRDKSKKDLLDNKVAEYAADVFTHVPAFIGESFTQGEDFESTNIPSFLKLKENIPLSQRIVSENLISKDELKKFVDIRKDLVFSPGSKEIENLIEEFHLFSALNKISDNLSFDSAYVARNKGFARAIYYSDDFFNGLMEDKPKVNKFFDRINNKEVNFKNLDKIKALFAEEEQQNFKTFSLADKRSFSFGSTIEKLNNHSRREYTESGLRVNLQI